MNIASMVLVAALAAAPVNALACNDHAVGGHPATQAAGRESAWSQGEVREVDLEETTITLTHERIASLRMGAMSSMLIKAANPALISEAKPGDKVRFRVRVVGEQPTLTRLTIAGKP